ncbi:MAG: hypothetical protein ACXVXO_00360 [Mycobacteriaceae bacterium]
MTALWQLLEILGMACLVGCAFLIYPPAALAVAGLLLIVAANLHAARKPKPKGDA